MSESTMRIVVLVKRLPKKMVGPGGQPLGECTLAALAAAMSLRTPLDGVVWAVSLGPTEEQGPALRAALRMGCDCAYSIGFKQRPVGELDYLGTATTLAVALRHVGYDLVLTADSGHDETDSALGPALAELLEVPHLTSVVAVRPGDRDQTVFADQRADGQVNRYRCTLPAVLSVRTTPERKALDVNYDPVTADTGETGRIEHVDVADLGVENRIFDRGRLGQVQDIRSNERVTLVGNAAELVSRLMADRLLR